VAFSRVSTSISLPVEILEAIDSRRGYSSRSAWIAEVLRREIEKTDRKNALDGYVKRVDL